MSVSFDVFRVWVATNKDVYTQAAWRCPLDLTRPALRWYKVLLSLVPLSSIVLISKYVYLTFQFTLI